jgi:DNA-binding CsgD family transcriptional regulator
LTPAEARLAVALTQGQTLEQAAERLAIRYETARTHLRRILEKTQTSRQADLMMLLSAFDGRLRMQTT